MNVKLLETEPSAILTCEARACDNVATHIGGLCDAHRRALKLSTGIQDAVVEFFNLPSIIRPGTRQDKDYVLAGQYLAHGIALLVGSLFDTEIVFNERPIYAQMNRSVSHNAPRWRVQFIWKIPSDEDDDE